MNINNLSDMVRGLQGGTQTTPASQPRTVQPPMGEQAELSVSEVLEVVQRANAALASNQANLKFQMDQESGKTIVQVVDQETQEVLRQIPSVEMLKIAKAIEKMQGVLVSKQA